MWFSGSCLLGDVDFGTSFAWVDLFGCVRQGCIFPHGWSTVTFRIPNFQKFLFYNFSIDRVDGKTLLDFFASKSGITEDDVAQAIRALCETLKDMHSKNVVHLDIRVSLLYSFFVKKNSIRFKIVENQELTMNDPCLGKYGT